MYQHLKDHIYYSELYDKFTIEKCQRWEKKKYQDDIDKLKGKEKKVGEIKKQWAENVVSPLALYFMKFERATKKSETIQEWMERDRAKDEKLANTREPEGVRCLGCSSLLEKCISRDLMDNHRGKEAILFMFECARCSSRRAYWENGKEWEHKPTCTKCKSEVQSENTKKDNVIITKYSCLHCGNTETDILDLNESKEEKIDPNFEANRKKYCLPESEGAEVMRKMERTAKLLDGLKEKDENKNLYDAIEKIKKLTIIELEKLLVPILEKAGYIKFQLSNPEIEKYAIVPFGVHDSKSDRSKMASEYDLKRLLKKTLEGTNWRLMSDGVNCRLGYLQGRLKGVEGEENLKKIINLNITHE